MALSKTSSGRAAARLSTSTLRAVHEKFVTGRDISYLESTPLRPVVAESWQRSLATGVDPDSGGAQPSSVAVGVANSSCPPAGARRFRSSGGY